MEGTLGPPTPRPPSLWTPICKNHKDPETSKLLDSMLTSPSQKTTPKACGPRLKLMLLTLDFMDQASF